MTLNLAQKAIYRIVKICRTSSGNSLGKQSSSIYLAIIELMPAVYAYVGPFFGHR